MPSQDLKRLKRMLNRFLKKNKDVQPGDPLFLLIIYAEGLRDAIELLIRKHSPDEDIIAAARDFHKNFGQVTSK